MNRAIKVYYSLIIEYNLEIASIGENINRYRCVWGWRKKTLKIELLRNITMLFCANYKSFKFDFWLLSKLNIHLWSIMLIWESEWSTDSKIGSIHHFLKIVVGPCSCLRYWRYWVILPAVWVLATRTTSLSPGWQISGQVSNYRQCPRTHRHCDTSRMLHPRSVPRIMIH